MKNTCLLTLFALLFHTPASARDIEVTFNNGNVSLSGTLLLPNGSGPFPAVIFIHGSGPEDRSNSKARAKAFIKNGYAALIYDKRGVGKSGGDPKFAERFSFDVLADDAVAAAQLLATRPEIDKRKIGLYGASQGGWVAPLAATRFPVAFMIIVSGSVTTVGEDNLFERNARLVQEGFASKDIQEATEMHRVDQQVTRDGTRFTEFEELWNKYATAPWFKRVYLGDKPNPVNSPYRQWYITVVDFDPVVYLNGITIPVLWLYGDRTLDRFCPVEKSLEVLKQMEKKSHTILIAEGADHSLDRGSKDLGIDEKFFRWLAEAVEP